MMVGYSNNQLFLSELSVVLIEIPILVLGLVAAHQRGQLPNHHFDDAVHISMS